MNRPKGISLKNSEEVVNYFETIAEKSNFENKLVSINGIDIGDWEKQYDKQSLLNKTKLNRDLDQKQF